MSELFGGDCNTDDGVNARGVYIAIFQKPTTFVEVTSIMAVCSDDG